MENGQLTKSQNKWIKGQSGNPNGRPKGSKNKITLMKIALEGDLRVRLGKSAQDILEKAIQLAMSGDTSMIKLLVDKMIPTSKSVDEEPTKEKVQIFIDRLQRDEVPVIQGRVVEDNLKEVN